MVRRQVMELPVRRIINGLTYNTATSMLVAKAEEHWEFNDLTRQMAGSREHRLYQTRGGAFFLVSHLQTSRLGADRKLYPIDRHEFEALTPSQAEAWATENPDLDVELLSDVFEEPPEAGDENEDPERTVYVRMPASLHRGIEGAAQNEGLSINAWALRSLQESYLASRKAKLEVVEE
jgi:hypothetical protein